MFQTETDIIVIAFSKCWERNFSVWDVYTFLLSNDTVIFNDYLNCLWGNPTTAKELPLIDAAHKAGCEYFCVDAGWYADGFWWDNVGEWLPSKERFPNGLEKVMD